jgi:hypothetical protein
MDFLLRIDRGIASTLARIAETLGFGSRSLLMAATTTFISAFIAFFTVWWRSPKQELDWLIMITLGLMVGSAIVYITDIYRHSPDDLAKRFKNHGVKWLHALRPVTILLVILFPDNPAAGMKLLLMVMLFWDYARSLHIIDIIGRTNASHFK